MPPLSPIMTEIEAISDLDILHPRAIMQIDGLIERHGSEIVARALGYLYAQARYDNRLLTRQVEAMRTAAR